MFEIKMAQVLKCQAVTVKNTACQRNAVIGNYCAQHSKMSNVCNVNTTDTDIPNNIKNLSHPFDVYKYIVNNAYTPELNKQLIKIVLSQVHPDIKIDKETLEHLGMLTYKLYSDIAEAKTEDDLISKIKKFPKELSRHCVLEYHKAKLRYLEQ